MRIARGIFDSATPGIAQFGGSLAAFTSYTYVAVHLEQLLMEKWARRELSIDAMLCYCLGLPFSRHER